MISKGGCLGKVMWEDRITRDHGRAKPLGFLFQMWAGYVQCLPLERKVNTDIGRCWCSRKRFPQSLVIFFSVFFFFNIIFKIYIIVLVLPNIKMNPSQVYMSVLSLFNLFSICCIVCLPTPSCIHGIMSFIFLKLKIHTDLPYVNRLGGP